MATNYALVKVETNPQIDAYHRDTMGETLTTLTIDPSERKVFLTQEYDDNATSEAAWNGRIIERVIHSHPDTSQATAYLTNNDLVQAVIDGHSIDWNGSNNVGHLTDEASQALDQIEKDLEDCDPTEAALWSVDDYLAQAQFDIEANTTDEQLAVIETGILDTARGESATLEGDVMEYLKEKRQTIQDREEWSAAAAVLGRKGGSATSEAKTAAAKINGKKGGRPSA